MATVNHEQRDAPGADIERRPAVRPGVVERRDEAARERLVQRVMAEFREMPCLRLTPAEAARLFGLRADVSVRIIEALADAGRLRQDEDGRYAAVEAS